MDIRKVLSTEEVAQYHRDGFLVPKYRFSAEIVKKLQKLTRQLVADNPEALDGIGSPHLKNARSNQQVKTEDGWLDIAAHPDMIDIVAQLIGPDVVLWASTLFYKEPKKGIATPWHRDAAFYPIEPNATTTVWIAVFDSVKENGCLRAIPGSHLSQEVGAHREGHWKEKGTGGSLIDIDESTAVDVELSPGQMVIFDVYTTHGSWPNLGTRERAGYAVRFFPATSYYDHDADDENYKVAGGVGNRELILVKGEDRAGNRFGSVSKITESVE